MAKKKFKDTKIGKLLTSKVGKTLIGSIPIIGDAAENLLTETKGEKGEVQSEPGKIDWTNPQGIIRGVIVAVLLYLALKGHISWDEADQAKEFITN